MNATRSPRILIIDNDEAMVRAIETRLSSLGCECLTASTGLQGMAIFEQGDIDLIITDLNMPAMDGAELVEKVRRSSDVPMIIVTGFGKAFADKLKDAINVTVVNKPFSSQDLIDLVTMELALSGKRMAG